MKRGKFNTFHSTQNPLQCCFHTLSILCMNGNAPGRRAVAPQRRPQESHGFQEVWMLQEILQKVDVCLWCSKEGFCHWIRSHSVHPLSHLYIGPPWLFPLLSPVWSKLWHPQTLVCLFLCTGIYWFFQHCTLTGRYEIQLLVFWLNSWKEGSEFPRLCRDVITIFGDTLLFVCSCFPKCVNTYSCYIFLLVIYFCFWVCSHWSDSINPEGIKEDTPPVVFLAICYSHIVPRKIEFPCEST